MLNSLFWPFLAGAAVAFGAQFLDPHVLRQLAYALWAYGAVAFAQSFL